MIVRAILLSVSALALTACQSVNVQSDIDWSGRDDDAPEAAAVAPAEFDGPGADWRTLAQSEILDRLARPEREGRARNVIVFIGDGLNLSTITAARIAFGGLAATPKRANALEAALTGQPWNDASVTTAMAALAQDFTPLSDMRASAEYRLETAKNMLSRYFDDLNGNSRSVLEVQA